MLMHPSIWLEIFFSSIKCKRWKLLKIQCIIATMYYFLSEYRFKQNHLQQIHMKNTIKLFSIKASEKNKNNLDLVSLKIV